MLLNGVRARKHTFYLRLTKADVDYHMCMVSVLQALTNYLQ